MLRHLFVVLSFSVSQIAVLFSQDVQAQLMPKERLHKRVDMVASHLRRLKNPAHIQESACSVEVCSLHGCTWFYSGCFSKLPCVSVSQDVECLVPDPGDERISKRRWEQQLMVLRWAILEHPS